MSKNLIYYRGLELISPQDLKRLRKLWGNTPFVYVNEFPIDHNTGTGLHSVTEIVFTIQCNEKLNERSKALKERIKKGLTHSKGFLGGYVERNLLKELVKDAIKEFNKFAEKKIEIFGFPFDEVCRLYNIPPRTSVIKEMDKEEAKIGIVPKPKKIYKVKHHWPMNKDQCSTYKKYYIKGKLAYSCNKHEIYKKFPYLGKLYYSYDENYIQIYVNDYHKSNNALQNVIGYLVENELITLE